MGEYLELDGEAPRRPAAVIEQFAKENLKRLRTGKIAGSPWMVATAREALSEVCNHLAASRIDLPELQQRFRTNSICPRRHPRSRHAAASCGRRKARSLSSESCSVDRGASLIQNVALEGCSRQTDFDEDQFVGSYPYLPHLIDLSMDIMAGLQLHPHAPIHLGGGNRTIVKQSFEMLFVGPDPAGRSARRRAGQHRQDL